MDLLLAMMCSDALEYSDPLTRHQSARIASSESYLFHLSMALNPAGNTSLAAACAG